ncbi:MAG: hypothetical protein AAGA40_10625 [Cyanobacteria bacterium P01_E01_bin.45]
MLPTYISITAITLLDGFGLGGDSARVRQLMLPKSEEFVVRNK